MNLVPSLFQSWNNNAPDQLKMFSEASENFFSNEDQNFDDIIACTESKDIQKS